MSSVRAMVANGFAILKELIRASTDFVAIVLVARVIVHVVAIVAIAAVGVTLVSVALPIL